MLKQPSPADAPPGPRPLTSRPHEHRAPKLAYRGHKQRLLHCSRGCTVRSAASRTRCVRALASSCTSCCAACCRERKVHRTPARFCRRASTAPLCVTPATHSTAPQRPPTCQNYSRRRSRQCLRGGAAVPVGVLGACYAAHPRTDASPKRTVGHEHGPKGCHHKNPGDLCSGGRGGARKVSFLPPERRRRRRRRHLQLRPPVARPPAGSSSSWYS
mgnify:CR=1 FL=1